MQIVHPVWVRISGYNITIIVSIMSVLVVRLFGRRRSFPILIAGIVAYTILVGASASVVRASLMGGITLLAIYLGRQAQAMNSLFAAGIVMTLLDPNTLFDVGFQLSFMATLGLVVYATPFTRATEGLVTRLFSRHVAQQAVGLIKDALLVTLAAQVTTLPLLMVYFRQISVVSLIVNPLVLPAQTGVMIFGLLATGIGLLSIPLGQIAAWTVWPWLTWTLGVIHLFARFPFAAIPLDYVPPLFVLTYYAGLLGLTWYFKQPSELRPEMLKSLLTPRRVIFVGGLIALLLAVAWSWRTDEHLHVYVLDVDGHPVLVQTPSGKQILIGGSNSPSSLLSALGNFLPFWDRNLEVVIVPQASGDQLNGLSAVLDRYDVQQLMSVEVSPDNRAGRDWQAMLTQKGKKPIELQNAELDAGVSLTFDGAVPLIEAQGCAIALGASERAQIAVIAGKLDRLPTQPQLILTWAPVLSDTRTIDLTGHGTLDLTFEGGGIAIGEIR